MRDFGWPVALAISSIAGCAIGGAEETGYPSGPYPDAPNTETDDDAGADGSDGWSPETSGDASPVDVAADTGGETLLFPPDDGGCTPKCAACGADDGCGGKCKTGTCAGSEKCVAGACVAPTRSYLSPGSYAFGSAFPRGLTMTLASETPSTIRYTIDGSTPSATSPSLPSPADVFVSSSGAMLRWFADNGAPEPTVHSFSVNLNAADQNKYGFLVEQVDISGKSPVLVTSPGAAVSGTASYQVWTSAGCPPCRLQVIYGIENGNTDCFYDWSPNVWPGVKASGTIKGLKAPTTPGVYKLNVTYTLQNSCAEGLATKPMGVRPTMEVGVVVVK